MNSPPVPGRILLGALMWAVAIILYYLFVYPFQVVARLIKRL